MDDFLSERDQWDAVKQWLKENTAWIVAGVLIGIAGLYGWRWYQERLTVRAQTAATRYADVLEALTRNDRTRAQQLADGLAKDYGETPYVDHARLVMARSDVETGKLDDAVRRLGEVAAESDDRELRNVARLRLARVQIMQGKADEALATLGKAEPGAFAAGFEHVRGDALLAKGDSAGALAAYRKAAAATEPGLVDQGLLQLKIDDLASATPPPASAAASDDAAGANPSEGKDK